jgi:hypothetical protein
VARLKENGFAPLRQIAFAYAQATSCSRDVMRHVHWEKQMHFYKYLLTNKYALNIIKHSEIYLSKPLYFNDPFDCKSNVYYQGTYKEWFDKLKSIGYNEIYSHQLATQYQNKYLTIDELNLNKIDRESHGIFCLTKDPKNILMWSHYADSHKGICLEFTPVKNGNYIGFPIDPSYSISDPIDNLLSITKVSYSKQMPPAYNHIKQNIKHYIEFLLTKHKQWQYEKEFRVIFPIDYIKNNPVQIERSCISGVIFGLYTPQIIKNKIIRIIEQHYLKKGHNFNLYQCNIVKNKYNLSIDKI